MSQLGRDRFSNRPEAGAFKLRYGPDDARFGVEQRLNCCQNSPPHRQAKTHGAHPKLYCSPRWRCGGNSRRLVLISKRLYRITTNFIFEEDYRSQSPQFGRSHRATIWYLSQGGKNEDKIPF